MSSDRLPGSACQGRRPRDCRAVLIRQAGRPALDVDDVPKQNVTNALSISVGTIAGSVLRVAVPAACRLMRDERAVAPA